MPESADHRAERLLAIGLQLAASVRDLDPAEYIRPLAHLTRAELEHLAVVLAACVDVEQTPGDLLAWCTRPAPADLSAPADVSALVAERFGLPVPRGDR